MSRQQDRAARLREVREAARRGAKQGLTEHRALREALLGVTGVISVTVERRADARGLRRVWAGLGVHLRREVACLYGDALIAVARGTHGQYADVEAALERAAQALGRVLVLCPDPSYALPHAIWLDAERHLARAVGMTPEVAEAEVLLKTASGCAPSLAAALMTPGTVLTLPVREWLPRAQHPAALPAVLRRVANC